jgi:hypothetical protein
VEENALIALKLSNQRLMFAGSAGGMFEVEVVLVEKIVSQPSLKTLKKGDAY